MTIRATALAAALMAVAAFGAQAAGPDRRDPRPAETPAPKTPAEIRADLYVRLAASVDAEETEGLVELLFVAYNRTGSDTVDLLLQRAHKATVAENPAAARQILDAAVAVMPDDAAVWNARATLRYLDEDADGAMADIAETLKREPRHIGALVGMANLLEAHDQTEDALAVYARVLTIAPHWKTAEDAAARLKAKAAGQTL